MTNTAPVKELSLRDQLRRDLVGNTPKADSEIIKLWGHDVELRQPSFGSILESSGETDERYQTAKMLVNYVYVPGTDERVFEDTDIPQILKWPFGPDLKRLQEAITKLTGLDVTIVQEALEADPLEEPQ